MHFEPVFNGGVVGLFELCVVTFSEFLLELGELKRLDRLGLPGYFGWTGTGRGRGRGGGRHVLGWADSLVRRYPAENGFIFVLGFCLRSLLRTKR